MTMQCGNLQIFISSILLQILYIVVPDHFVQILQNVPVNFCSGSYVCKFCKLLFPNFIYKLGKLSPCIFFANCSFRICFANCCAGLLFVFGQIWQIAFIFCKIFKLLLLIMFFKLHKLSFFVQSCKFSKL